MAKNSGKDVDVLSLRVQLVRSQVQYSVLLVWVYYMQSGCLRAQMVGSVCKVNTMIPKMTFVVKMAVRSRSSDLAKKF